MQRNSSHSPKPHHHNPPTTRASSTSTTPNNKPPRVKKDIKNYAMLYGTAWKKERSKQLISQALGLGFRGVDTACQPKHYNEKGVGDGIVDAMEKYKLTRDDIFIQTKFSPIDAQDPNHIDPPNPNIKPHPYYIGDDLETQVDKSLAVSLSNLNTDYLDSWVLHGPLSTYTNTLKVWRAMEKHVDNNTVDQLGISNCYNLKFLQQLAKDSKHLPKVIQNRFYPDTHWDVGIRAWARENDITYQSFWTLTGNPNLLQTPTLNKLALDRQTSPQNILYMYLIQRGCQPLNGSCTAAHIREDLAMAGNINDENRLSNQDLKSIGVLIKDEF